MFKNKYFNLSRVNIFIRKRKKWKYKLDYYDYLYDFLKLSIMINYKISYFFIFYPVS